MEEWLVVVPARLESTRLKEKPLQDICGKAMIVRVYENLEPLRELGAKTVVATDSKKIFEVCEKENIEVEMTSQDHQSGTDRCFEVASRHERQYILNVQGDEPFVDTDTLINLCHKVNSADWADIGTVVHRVEDGKGYFDPNVVKTTLTTEGKALYFSRSPIPYNRENKDEPQPFYHHQGIYAYNKDSLARFVELPVSPLEKSEKLEQLRALEHGMNILCVLSSKQAHGVDTKDDLDEAIKIYQRKFH